MLSKQSIVKLLQQNDKAVGRALVVLTNRQTADEQASEHTRYLNGRGFRPCHARMGTSMAKFFQRNGYLTPKQIAYWRVLDKTGAMRIGIYAGQLLEEAIEKQKIEKQQETIIAEQNAAIQKALEAEVGMALDSEDPAIIQAAQDELDAFMAKIKRG